MLMHYRIHHPDMRPNVLSLTCANIAITNIFINNIIPPTNVTIPLPHSPNDVPNTNWSGYSSVLHPPRPSTALNIRTTDYASAAESPSFIFSDANRVFNVDNAAEITSPDIHYASEP